jgi:serine/threonine-protein kinase
MSHDELVGASVTQVIQRVDGLCCQLKESHDLGWLRAYGQVFAVYDQQDSGNLCFGVTDGVERRFIKYAGARTVAYVGDPQEAVLRLRHAIPVYQELAHPVLVRLSEYGERGAGYAGVFEWAVGECLHAHWSFDRYPKYQHSRSPNVRFRQLPLADRLACLEAILSFHLVVATRGYVAIDFYDGSIMYDFVARRTTICDIDLYARRPYVNQTGRLWGSSRFMSPEEHEVGASIDEVTNVYTMGATAFELLGDNRDRSLAAWLAPEALWHVARRAVSTERHRRQQSIAALYDEWHSALT